MVACELLHDLEIIKMLIEAGADPNSVNTDDKMPLTFVKERLAKAMEGENKDKLKAVEEYLISTGAKANWRDTLPPRYWWY